MNDMKETLPGQGFLESVRRSLEADVLNAEAKINLYLKNPVGVGEHPNIADEILKAAEQGAHAEEVLDFLNERFD
jgi:hypothetical protein